MSGCLIIQTQQQKELMLKNRRQTYDDKMYELTALYYDSIEKSIMDKSEQGIRELNYNLSRVHFEFNLPKTGEPSEMCNAWLIQMRTPGSMYLLKGLKNGVISYRDHFQGLKFDFCNNKHAAGSSFFSVHLTW